jgi:hypothetical protein
MHRKVKDTPEYQKLRILHESMVWTLEKLVTEEESEKQVSFLREIKRSVILKAIELGLANHAIPMLPVIPKKCMGISRQMSFIKYEDSPGQAHLNLHKVDDVVDIPHFHPYWIFGLEFEMETINMTPEQAMNRIAEKGRSPLTLSETVSLLLHHCILGSFSLHACGSSYRPLKDDTVVNVPSIYLDHGIPMVSWSPLKRNVDIEGIKPWVTPSCRGRIGTLGIRTVLQCRPWRKRKDREEGVERIPET